jgi:hypothetical protein
MTKPILNIDDVTSQGQPSPFRVLGRTEDTLDYWDSE